ncbi:hypothetical protein M3202_08275 [Alkalihalobacillus oceani]|uniref:Uncharacterized protein n=1 Tax=Halalkalibacter oceani TaxID=1653776 RepID=A0A9X2IP48_9BACI|nr:hypothetical protein [Halalkalibacter oceani]MCM3714082.1 hypothetical protein [Halalkalibacter oceani]
MDKAIIASDIKNKNMADLLDYLRQFERATRGTPSSAHKELVLQQVLQVDDDEARMKHAEALDQQDSPTSLELAAHVCASAYA